MAETTPEQRQANLEMFEMLQSGGGAPNVALPPTQKYAMFRVTKDIQEKGLTSDPDAPAPPTGWIYFKNPNYVEKSGGRPQKLDDGSVVNVYPDGTYSTVVPATPKPQTVDQITVPANGRIYTVDPNDPNGNFVARTPTTADEQDKANKVAERTQNLALNGHYATNEEILDFNVKLQKAGIDKTAAAETQRVSEANQRRLDAEETRKNAEEARKAALQPGTLAQQGATLAQTGATTGATEATAAQTRQATEATAAKLPGELAQQTATRLGTEAGTANQLQATQIAGAPAAQTPPTGMSIWQRDPLTGQVRPQGVNPEYIPKSTAEVAARAAQINSAAAAKKAEVMGKVGVNYTADQALQEFNSWYDQQVQPQLGMLDQAQQAAALEQTKQQAAMRQGAMTSALGAGDQAQKAYDSFVKTSAGPNYENIMSQITRGTPTKNIDMTGASTFAGPNPMDLVQQRTQEALKYIDPTAAQAAGLPPPNLQATDYSTWLGRERYWPGGTPPPGAGGPPGGGGAAVAAPPAPVAAPPPEPVQVAPPPQPGMEGLLPPGFAGVPGLDPRLSGVWDPSMYQAPNYSPFG